MTAIETAVRVIVDLLVRGEYEVTAAVTRGVRLSAADMARAIADYGRHLAPPPEEWWSLVEVTPPRGHGGYFHVAAPLWTTEEGRSDLTLELGLVEFSRGVFDTEVLDIHVL